MARRRTPIATEAELELLRLLWSLGPSTVRELREALARLRPTGYTTVLKLLQIMAERGLVRRDESERAHRYEAVAAEVEFQTRFLDHLTDSLFGGSTSRLVQRALTDGAVSAEELAEIRALLDEAEGAGEGAS